MSQNATDVGPYLEACRNAWTAARNEAMANLGMRDDPEQEGWEKLGPLADPGPANAKNRGAAVRKERSEEGNGQGGEQGATTTTQETTQAEGHMIGEETL